jgi:hypothetical protein
MKSNSARTAESSKAAKLAQPRVGAKEPIARKTAPLEEPGIDMQRALHDDYDLRSHPLSSKPARLIALNRGSYDHNLF